MSLATPESVQRLQAALHAKAKGEPNYRFYMLYDKVHRPDVLAHAYACCRGNHGAAGVDGRTFEDIEAYGVERWLGEAWPDGRPTSRGRKREAFSESRMREIRPSGSMSGVWKRSTARNEAPALGESRRKQQLPMTVCRRARPRLYRNYRNYRNYRVASPGFPGISPCE